MHNLHPSPNYRSFLLVLVVCAPFFFASTSVPAGQAAPEASAFAEAIENMKSSPKGPFERIRWFCKDGSILPPEPFACKDHGGGSQHGQWSEQTRKIREAGYLIANIYADLDDGELVARPHFEQLFAQMTIEKFLIAADDGWIMRKARFYRGAFQDEGEREGSRRLLIRLAGDDEWITRRYLPFRIAAGLLKHGPETASSQMIRQLSSSLAQKDPDFANLRNRIHSLPTVEDVALVRQYAERPMTDTLREEYHELVRKLDEFYATHTHVPTRELGTYLEQNKDQEQAVSLQAALGRLESATSARDRFRYSADLLVQLRDLLPEVSAASTRLQFLDASVAIEAQHMSAATEMNKHMAGFSRGERLLLLGDGIRSLYGAGYLSSRQRLALEAGLQSLVAAAPGLGDYRKGLDYLALAMHWVSRNLDFHFAEAMGKLAEIEPKARLFQQDQLRSSPLFFFARVIDDLILDGNTLAGVKNKLFEKNTGGGIRALNPGLARGVLVDARGQEGISFQRDGIYILPETISDLPPVAGILTAGEGNPLSHVQLLARNLGIPNVALDASLLDDLVPELGKRVLLAVSPGGGVSLQLDIEPDTRQDNEQASVLIHPDLEKLNLGVTDLIDLADLRVADSGRIVGPKAAKLGELKQHFPQAVADGIAIPFGVFRQLLQRSSPDKTNTMFHWMKASYDQLEKLPAGSKEREVETGRFRHQVEQWLLSAQLWEELREQLRTTLTSKFGEDGSFGVFVRSDTNVEDLPGFTGAGLNLTVPNVVGIENIFRAIIRVWASPFSARAFAWRQSLMDTPEHVYPAVLLLQSVNVDKSGVMVTEHLETGATDWISIAVNEGVGGAVDGQSAESLRIHQTDGEVQLMAQASTPVRRQLGRKGGIEQLAVSGSDRVLAEDEIRQLLDFARTLPDKFPPVVDARGEATAADIEFGFLNGQLKLFQIRPFIRNEVAEQDTYLRSLDPPVEKLRTITVDLEQPPVRSNTNPADGRREP